MYRALLVEDDSSWAEILTELLQDLHFTIYHASTYEEGLHALHNGPYDLALLDVSLVSANHENRAGIQILQQLRLYYPHLPAIILTGHATVDLAIQALTDLKVTDFLRKERFDRAHFQNVVQSIVGTMNPQPAPPTPITSVATPQVAIKPLAAHVLVVEDQLEWQSIYEELLAEIGADMKIAISYGEAHGLLRREKFDVAIIDLNLISNSKRKSNLDGFHLLRLTQTLHLPTIVISGLGDPSTIDHAYEKHDIFAFLEKEGFHRTIFQNTLREAITNPLSSNPLNNPFLSIENSPIANLTPRQREVLNLLASGMTNNQIAKELFVTVNTIKKHVLAIFSTLEVNTRAAAAGIAARYGLGK